MPAPASPQVKELARSLWEQGATVNTIAAELSLSPNTINSWVKRAQWKRQPHKPSPAINPHDQPVTQPVTPSPAPSAPSAPALVHVHLANPMQRLNVGLAITSSGLQARDRIRDALGAEIIRQLSVLQAEPITGAQDLRNTRERQGLAAVAKTLADAAGSVFDFQEHTTGMVWAAELARPATVKPTADSVIDVISEIDPPKPLQLQGEQLNATNIVRNIEPAQDQAASPGQPAQEPPGSSMLSGQPGAAPPPP